MQIRTHYPRALQDEITIMEHELPVMERFDRTLRVPEFMQEIVGPVHLRSAACPRSNQASG